MSRLVARVGRPHGLRGEVTVRVHTDDPEGRFAAGTRLDTVAAPGTGVPRSLTVRSARRHRDAWLVAFEEVPDRTGAESLRGTELHLADDPGDGARDAGEDAWYEDELVGLRVLDPSGAELGTVAALEVGAAQDLLVLRLSAGGSARVPFVRRLVPVVDVPGGRVVVDPPPGLLELDAGG
jgi:16S rRNA processing protein RimM